MRLLISLCLCFGRPLIALGEESSPRKLRSTPVISPLRLTLLNAQISTPQWSLSAGQLNSQLGPQRLELHEVTLILCPHTQALIALQAEEATLREGKLTLSSPHISISHYSLPLPTLVLDPKIPRIGIFKIGLEKEIFFGEIGPTVGTSIGQVTPTFVTRRGLYGIGLHYSRPEGSIESRGLFGGFSKGVTEHIWGFHTDLQSKYISFIGHLAMGVEQMTQQRRWSAPQTLTSELEPQTGIARLTILDTKRMSLTHTASWVEASRSSLSHVFTQLTSLHLHLLNDFKSRLAGGYSLLDLESSLIVLHESSEPSLGALNSYRGGLSVSTQLGQFKLFTGGSDLRSAQGVFHPLWAGGSYSTLLRRRTHRFTHQISLGITWIKNLLLRDDFNITPSQFGDERGLWFKQKLLTRSLLLETDLWLGKLTSVDRKGMGYRIRLNSHDVTFRSQLNLDKSSINAVGLDLGKRASSPVQFQVEGALIRISEETPESLWRESNREQVFSPIESRGHAQLPLLNLLLSDQDHSLASARLTPLHLSYLMFRSRVLRVSGQVRTWFESDQPMASHAQLSWHGRCDCWSVSSDFAWLRDEDLNIQWRIGLNLRLGLPKSTPLLSPPFAFQKRSLLY